jgi:hypothetical protein
MARLSRQSINRIGAAVRAVESSRGGGGAMPGDFVSTVLRVAQVTDTIEDNPDAGKPYVYEATVYAGHWKDDQAVRPSILEEVEVWSATELDEDDWVAIARVGGHWEVLGGAGGTDLPPGENEGDLLQWTQIPESDPADYEWTPVAYTPEPPTDPAHYTTLGANTKGNEAADTATWTAGDVDGSSNPLGLRFWVQSRQAYYHDGDKKWYAYARQLRYTPNGRLYSISVETRIEIHAPVSLASELE